MIPNKELAGVGSAKFKMEMEMQKIKLVDW